MEQKTLIYDTVAYLFACLRKSEKLAFVRLRQMLFRTFNNDR